MRRHERSSLRRTVLGCASAIALLSVAWPAAAQSALDQSFSEGFSLLRFDPAPAGDRFFAVSDASASDAEEMFRAMLLGHYTLKPTLVRVDADTGERREIVSSQLYGHLDLSMVPASWLLLNVDVPVALVQSGEGPAAPDSPAFGDVRLTARARVVGSEHAPFSFAPAVDLWVPTGSEDNLTGDGSVRVQPKLVASGRAGAFIYAVNAGFLVREYLDTGSLEVGNSLTFGAGAGVLLLDDVLQVGGELHGGGFLASERDDNFASSTSPLEALFGVKLRASDMVFGGGIGPGLSDAPGSAPRVVLSIAYAPATPYQAPSAEPAPEQPPTEAAPTEPGEAPLAQPADADGDGVPDSSDNCPNEAGQQNAVPSLNGCPAPVETSKSDRDGDGIADESDACPDQSGASSADSSRNGCPEGPLDTDGDGIPDDKDTCPREAASQADGGAKNGCPGDGPAEATYAGFRPAPNGGATVFVQLTDAVKIEPSAGKAEVSYLMKGTKVGIRNNRNPLLAAEFGSAVSRAQLVPEKDGVRLVLNLKADVKTTHRLVRLGKGAVLEVSVPPLPAAPAGN